MLTANNHAIGDFQIPEWQLVKLSVRQKQQLDLNIEKLTSKWQKKQYNCKERIWDVKRKIRFKTYLSQIHTGVTASRIPSHLYFVQAPSKALSLLVQTKLALDFLFRHILDVNSAYVEMMHHEKEHYVTQYKSRGLVYFPNNDLDDYERHGRCTTPDLFRQFLRSNSRLRVVDEFWAQYMEVILQHLTGSENISDEQRTDLENIINEHGMLYLLKYEPGTGIWMHIDNLLRSDATVFTVGIGRSVVYDATEIIGRDTQEQISLLRTCNPEGTMMVMDGSARYEWAHGVPYDRKKRNGTKYTIILRLFHHEKLSKYIGKCVELDADMFTMLEKH